MIRFCVGIRKSTSITTSWIEIWCFAAVNVSIIIYPLMIFRFTSGCLEVIWYCGVHGHISYLLIFATIILQSSRSRRWRSSDDSSGFSSESKTSGTRWVQSRTYKLQWIISQRKKTSYSTPVTIMFKVILHWQLILALLRHSSYFVEKGFVFVFVLNNCFINLWEEGFSSLKDGWIILFLMSKWLFGISLNHFWRDECEKLEHGARALLIILFYLVTFLYLYIVYIYWMYK